MTNELTVDELLKPRYKVIAGYPLSKMYFNIGDVLYWNEKYESYRIDEKRVSMDKETVESYPHLFKRLEWWEEREASEMPIYVRYGELDKQHAYYKIKELHLNDKSMWNFDYYAFAEQPKDYFLPFRASNFYPATESEYLQWLNSKGGVK